MRLPGGDIAQLLTQKGLLAEDKLREVLMYSQNKQVPFDDALVDVGVVSDEQLGQVMSEYLRLPFVVLSKLTIPEDVLRIIPERIARKYKVIAFHRDTQGLKIATSEPKLASEVLEMIGKKITSESTLYYATDKDINQSFRLYRKVLQDEFDELIKSAEFRASMYPDSEGVSAASVVDLLIKDAYSDKASDIHIEPQENASNIRFRVDGILHDTLTIPKSLHDQVIARIKVLSRLRTDEHLSPQDGKMRVELEEEDLDVRVSIVPVADGEKAVLRLLSSKSRNFSLSQLGMNHNDLQKVIRGFNKSYGMVLSTGPTGSGKTTSIYSILKILNTREKNITTTEDPVEYRIQGVNQIQINPKAELTFASSLRSILRQDPNIIFVGEIRDGETAGIAVNAALTGHLVLSTLHTNDAATALPRLIDMNIEPFLVASTINVIIAQRLLRTICRWCRVSQTISREHLNNNLPAEIGKKHFPSDPIVIYKGRGCERCHGSGYMGRIGVFEILEVNDVIRKLIIERQDSDVIAKAAQESGMTTMLDDGMQKVRSGITTLEEVLRVTKVES